MICAVYSAFGAVRSPFRLHACRGGGRIEFFASSCVARPGLRAAAAARLRPGAAASCAALPFTRALLRGMVSRAGAVGRGGCSVAASRAGVLQGACLPSGHCGSHCPCDAHTIRLGGAGAGASGCDSRGPSSTAGVATVATAAAASTRGDGTARGTAAKQAVRKVRGSRRPVACN